MSWYQLRRKVPLRPGSAVSGCGATAGRDYRGHCAALLTSPPARNLLGPFLPVARRQASKSGTPEYCVYFIFSFHNSEESLSF